MSRSGDTILQKGNDGEKYLYVWYVSLKIVFMPLVTDKLLSHNYIVLSVQHHEWDSNSR